MFNSSPGGRATATDVRFQLGLASFAFDLMTVFVKDEDDEDTAMQVACPHPDHKGAGVKASQRYLCTENPAHPPYTLSELLRRADNAEGKSVIVPADEVKAIRTGGMPTKLCELRVHPAAEISSITRPGSKGYLLRPSKTNRKITEAAESSYSLLYRFVTEHPEVALVGDLVAPSRRTYRVTTYGRQLFLQQIVLPVNQRELDEVDLPPADDRTYAQLEYLADLSLEHFDPADYSWDVKEAMAELKARATAAAEGGEAAPAPAFDPANIDAALEAAVQARLAAKAAEVTA